MKPLSAFPHAELHTIRGGFTEIDHTLTTNWQLPMSAFDAVDGSHHQHWNVRFWLLADIQPHPQLCLLYPQKRTFGG